MKQWFAVRVVLLMLSPALVWAAEYGQISAARSTVTFVSRQMGVPVPGAFKRLAARLSFDPARPEAARAAIDMDLASIEVGSREAYDEVMGKNWFNVSQFPQAHFEVAAVRALGGNRYAARGTMTIKGHSREVVAPFTFTASGRDGVFAGSFVLRRLEFGIGEGPWGDPGTVADEVEVKFHLVASEVAPTGPAKKR